MRRGFWRRFRDTIERRFLAPYTTRLELTRDLVRDARSGEYPDVPWRTVITASAALVYLLNPFDPIPDFIPVLGQLDDLAVLVILFKAIDSDLRDYAAWRGLNPDELGW